MGPWEPGASRPTSSGVARDVDWRQEPEPWGRVDGARELLTFRLERHDANGAELPSMAVEMGGARIRGELAEGEWVEVEGRPPRDEPWTPRRIRNLSTGRPIVAVRRGAVARASIVAGLALAAVVMLLYGVWWLVRPA